jgi:hypothetical protein
MADERGDGLVKFTDLHEYDGRSCFVTTNESLGTWNDLLDGVKVERAASICSGGEVAFFAIAPRATQEVYLLDHAYGSLYFAIGKYNLIEKLGPTKAYKLLTSNDGEKIAKAFLDANKDLPTHGNSDAYAHWPTLRSVEQAASKEKPPPEPPNRYSMAWYDWYDRWGPRGYGRDRKYNKFASCWAHLDPKAISAFSKRVRERVSFVHGDINDLVDLGPFDLIYLSNALDYSGRSTEEQRKATYKRHTYGEDTVSTVYKIEEIVKPGGIVCFSYKISKPRVTENWTVLNETPRAKHNDATDTSWRYCVAQTPQKGGEGQESSSSSR